MFILFIFTFNTLHSKHITQAGKFEHKVSHPVFWPFNSSFSTYVDCHAQYLMLVERVHNIPLSSRLCHLCFKIYATVTNQHSKNLDTTSWTSLVWPEPCTWQRWNKQFWCMKTHMTELHLLETIRRWWLTVCCGWKTWGLAFHTPTPMHAHTHTHTHKVSTFSTVSTKQGIRIWMGLDLRT
jgi:hypothetical protein